jgi:hypothetical protein
MGGIVLGRGRKRREVEVGLGLENWKGFWNGNIWREGNASKESYDMTSSLSRIRTSIIILNFH